MDTQPAAIKTIVTLVDLSDVTPKVIQQSEAMATAFHARLILLHAVPEVPVVIDLGIIAPTVLEAPSDQRKEADYQKLLGLRDALAAAGIEVNVAQLEDGQVEKIFPRCELLEADLIIMGAHHHRALYQWLIGTRTAEMLQRAHCPVLVVPAD